MPLLKRKTFQRKPEPEFLRDHEEVFFNKQTKEVFRSYDEYFERMMLTSSIVWQCELTGRPNLTFSEALDSEKTARRLLRSFPQPLRGPVIFVANQTKRSALSELIDDVYSYVKDHFFKGEELDVMNESGRGCRFCKVIEPVQQAKRRENNLDFQNQFLEFNSSAIFSPKKTTIVNPMEIEYKVQAIDDQVQPQQWIAKGERLKRDKTVFTRDKNKLFLKQQVESVGGMLKIKADSLKKFVTDAGIKSTDVFIGKVPDFEVSKKLQLQQEKNSKPSTSGEPKIKKAKKDTKQGDITKYLNNSNSKVLTSEEKKKKDEQTKKFKDDLEKAKKENAEKEVEKQKRVAEERAQLLAKTQATVREHNQVRDDLELIDQRVIPQGKPVMSMIGERHFGDFVQILEFLHSFPELLSISDKFPNGITMDLLERAMILKEVNGPLSDILQVLLSTIFSLQIEDENEMDVDYRVNGDVPLRHPFANEMRTATQVQKWSMKHYSTRINELVMDSMTITELLRLHFLGSGAIISERGAKWRMQHRGGYQSNDDPGLFFTRKYPHILKAMKLYTVFQLPLGDIIKILKCLVDQILTYASFRELIEERVEVSAKAKHEFKMQRAAEKRRDLKVNDEKKALKEEYKMKLTEFAGTEREKDIFMKNFDKDLEEKLSQIDIMSLREKEKAMKEMKETTTKFFNHQVFLGTDRAFRNYFIYESLPGVFVEHDLTYSGKCVDHLIKNNYGLAHVTQEQRYAFIKQMVLNDKSRNDDKENKLGTTSLNGVAIETKSNGIKKEEGVKQEELYMCSTDPKTCIVHSSDHPDRVVWSYFNTTEEIQQLIDSLNTRGFREKVLRENLELEKELICTYIENCPVEKLTVLLDDKENKMNEIVKKRGRYDTANFNLEPGTDPSTIFDISLRENLLEFESRISLGYLGEIKVTDRMEWRKHIEELSYKAMTDELSWGVGKNLEHSMQNGNAQTNGHSNGEVEQEDDDAESVSSSIEDVSEPGVGLGNTTTIESEDSQDELISLHESQTLKAKITEMASALLQIEQGIDIKFIRAPFGPKKELKDKDLMANALLSCKKKLQSWEKSLMKCVSYAQVFLHYNILYDSILWSRSAQKMACMLCRSKRDPEQTLLCDECNKACHMYCLKPKLKAIPEGDWFCPRCRPENFKIKKDRKRKAKIFVVEEEEEEEAEDLDENIDDQDESGDDADATIDSDVQDICTLCNMEGDLSHCISCDLQCHPECAKPPMKDVKTKGWTCWRCKSLKDRSERSKKRRIEIEDDEGIEDAEDSPPPTKTRKMDRSSRSKRSLPETDDDEDYEEPEIKRSGRRSSRRESRKSRRSSVEQDGFGSDEEHERSSRRSSRKIEKKVDRRSSKRSMDYQFDSAVLYSLLEDVIKNKNSWAFARPVSMKEAPDYHLLIKTPMDLAKIKSKLNLGDYKYNNQMMKDIEQIFVNCNLYNEPGTETYISGTKLEKYVIKKCKDLNLPFNPSEMCTE